MIDYKKLIRNDKVRMSILRALRFVPDSAMVSAQYLIKTGRWPNLKNPKRFTEKLQWYKLNHRDELMVRCVDKGDVREYVTSKGLSDILIPCYGIYECVDEIDWFGLPDAFVMKDTLGSGGRSVEIVADKHSANLSRLVKKAEEWIEEDSKTPSGGREWPYYSGRQHRVLFEELLEADPNVGGLIDYKFFCFGGKPEVLYVVTDRVLGRHAGLGIYDALFNKIDAVRVDENPLVRDVQKPPHFDEMLSVASILSEGFPEVRIDLYEVEGHIYFGEMTFYDGSGYMSFIPDDFDYEFGKKFVLA